MVSSTAIGHLKNRQRGGLLRTVFVNSGGQRSRRISLDTITSPQEKTGEIGLTKTLDLPFHPAKFCLFSTKRNEHETRAFCREFTHVESRELLQRRSLK